jgi:hypothetical protein
MDSVGLCCTLAWSSARFGHALTVARARLQLLGHTPRRSSPAALEITAVNIAAGERVVITGRQPVEQLHGGRHTAATLALEAGIDVKIVSEQLGHSTTSITQSLYQHVSVQMQIGAARKSWPSCPSARPRAGDRLMTGCVRSASVPGMPTPAASGPCGKCYQVGAEGVGFEPTRKLTPPSGFQESS